jgi:hypothetical protein
VLRAIYLILKWNLSIYLNPQYFAATLALLWSADSLEPHNMVLGHVPPERFAWAFGKWTQKASFFPGDGMASRWLFI